MGRSASLCYIRVDGAIFSSIMHELTLLGFSTRSFGTTTPRPNDSSRGSSSHYPRTSTRTSFRRLKKPIVSSKSSRRTVTSSSPTEISAGRIISQWTLNSSGVRREVFTTSWSREDHGDVDAGSTMSLAYGWSQGLGKRTGPKTAELGHTA